MRSRRSRAFAGVRVRSPDPTPRTAANANASARRNRHPDPTHAAGPGMRPAGEALIQPRPRRALHPPELSFRSPAATHLHGTQLRESCGLLLELLLTELLKL